MTRDVESAARHARKYASYRRSWRAAQNRRRYQRVMDLVELEPTDRILDLGCGHGMKSLAYHNQSNPIVGLDLIPPDQLDPLGANFSYVQGNATDLSGFVDRSFNVVLSFGLLEHLTDDEVRAIVAQTSRVADSFAHVVPHPLAFVEPHTRMPFFGRWPRPARSLYLRLFPRRRSAEYWSRLYWRSADEWRGLFGELRPRVVRHWYGPLLLYYVIYGRISRPAAA